jgi:zinc D-Ala-D-Ala carboxypeptidase
MPSTQNFSHTELRCQHCGENDMSMVFLDRLQEIREEFGKPMRVNSGFRCPVHDAALGGKGPHATGRAVDIGISGSDALVLVELARGYGMTGIGVMQSGQPHKNRFIHMDDLADGVSGPRPWIWSYT